MEINILNIYKTHKNGKQLHSRQNYKIQLNLENITNALRTIDKN